MAVPAFFISSMKHELKILLPLGISNMNTTSNTPFSSKPLISFYQDSIKGAGAKEARTEVVSKRLFWKNIEMLANI